MPSGELFNIDIINSESGEPRFDPSKEGNSRKRKCGICCFGDSYSIRSKREYEKNLLFTMIEW